MIVYFLIDRAECVNNQYIGLIERQLNALVNQLNAGGDNPQSPKSLVDSLFQFKVLSMGPKTGGQFIEPSKIDWFQLPRKSANCDLGEALRLVGINLESELGVQLPSGLVPQRVVQASSQLIPIFIFLYAQPVGDWGEQIKALQARYHIKVTVLALNDQIDNQTLKAIATWPEGAWRPTGKKNLSSFISDSFYWIRNILNHAVTDTKMDKVELVVNENRGSGVGGQGTEGGRIQDFESQPWDDQATVLSPKRGSTPESQPPNPEPQPSTPNPQPQGVAMIWQQLEPPAEMTDRFPNTAVDHQTTLTLSGTSDGWHMIAASRRGKMHAHKGSFREDAFALGHVDGWHVMVVADGGGSCPLARVGANLAATTAVNTIMEHLRITNEELRIRNYELGIENYELESLIPNSQFVIRNLSIAKQALQEGLKQAYRSLVDEAEKRKVTLRDLGTTFLCVLHLDLRITNEELRIRNYELGIENYELESLIPNSQFAICNSSLIGVVQVGDGLLAAQLADGKIQILAEPDVGEAAGSTFFITSLPVEEWLERVHVQILPQSVQMLAAMCDGVADDFIPFERYLPKFFEQHLARLTDQEQSEENLLILLGYEKRGSFDDRTLTLLYHELGITN